MNTNNSHLSLKKVAKYTTAAGVGAIVLGTVGNIFGSDIADIIGIQPKHMGMEITATRELITYAGIVTGVVLGPITAYCIKRFYKSDNI